MSALIDQTARIRIPAGLLLLVCATAAPCTPDAAAQQLLVDANLEPYGMAGHKMQVAAGGRMFWFHGSLLGVSDGTAAGSRVVRAFLGDLHSLHTDGSRAFFFEGVSFTTARRLWVSDGTLAGTQVLAETVNYSGSNQKDEIAAEALNGRLFFVGIDAAHGKELWVSDGTVAGTGLFMDINPGPADAFGGMWDDMERVGQRLCFGAVDGVHGYEPWWTDGTVAGTGMIDDIVAGPNGSDPRSYAAFQNGMLLGTTRGVILTSGPGTSQQLAYPRGHSFTPLGSIAVFSGYDSVHGQELWSTDGTPAGTGRVLDINPAPVGTGSPGGSSWPGEFLAVGGRAVFWAHDSVHGFELWATDGTAGGTSMLIDIYPGPQSGLYTMPFLLWQGRAWAMASSPAGAVLLDTDGTTAGTQQILLGGTFTGYTYFTPVLDLGSQMGFFPSSPTLGTQPWVSAGTPATTQQLAQVIPWPNSTGFPAPGVPYRDRYYFSNCDPASGSEPWSSDGTAAGTQLFADLVAGAGSSSPRRFAALGDRALVFETSLGIEAVVDPAAGAQPIAAGTIAWSSRIHGRLILCVTSSATASALLSTDGTAAGTVVEFGGLSGTQSSVIGRLPDGRVVFFQRPATAYELWVTDGTGGGTTTIATGLATPQQALSGPGGVFYRSSAQMFFTDGTVAGTQTLASLGETRLLGVLGGFAFLRASDGVHGAELWRTDGTAAGTALFADLSPGPSSSSPFNGMVADGKLFFSARDPLLGNEPWVSDGTVAGTIMIADLNPGADDSGPQGFAAIGSRVLFNAFSPASGSELWISDGTPAGTSVLWDISPGPPSSSPASIVVGNDYVFLDAVHPTAGREEHSYPLTATGAAYTDSYGLGGLGSAGRPTTYADVLPHLGGTVQLGLRQVLTGSLAIAAWSFAASPVPLAPDCFQYVSPAALTIVVANSLGEASSSIAIPNVSVYVGVQVHGQYAVLDPLGCFLDAITPSDRRRFLVGH